MRFFFAVARSSTLFVSIKSKLTQNHFELNLKPMKNLTCSKCGFVNAVDATACKQCGSTSSKSSGAQPSITRIVKNYDYTILLILFPIAFFGMFLIVDVFGFAVRRRGVSVSRSDYPISLFLAVGTAVLAAAVLWWRVAFVRAVFARGQAVAGRITKVLLNPTNSGYVHYSYQVNDHEYQNKVGIAGRFVEPETIKSFQVGNEIELVVDRSKPKRALIKNLYL